MAITYQTKRKLAEAALSDAKTLIDYEIADYPTPISGCDAQFTHLLAERRRLCDAIEALAGDVFIPTPRTPDPFAGVESR